MNTAPIHTLAPGLHTVEAPQRFYGLEVGARMTLLEVEGGLIVHSPVAFDPGALAPLGPIRAVIAPNKLHHLHIGPWIDAGAPAWAAPGLPEKRPDLQFTGVLTDGPGPFGPVLQAFPLRCFPFTNEVVFLHRPSRTLVVTDLVFHFTPAAPWTTRLAMTCACGYPGCRTTALERFGFHRAVARREIGHLLSLDFDRLVMAHGEVIETGGREALRGAVAWLGL